MKTNARRHTGYILCLSFFLLILFFAIDGCKSEDDWPTSVPAVTYPAVAGHWVGTLRVIFSGNLTIDWAVDVNITQTKDTLAGTWLYVFTAPPGPNVGDSTLAKLKGTVTQTNKVTTVETSFQALNWNGQNWGLNSYVGTLSARGDTLSGRDTVAGSTDYFLLVKK